MGLAFITVVSEDSLEEFVLPVPQPQEWLDEVSSFSEGRHFYWEPGRFLPGYSGLSVLINQWAEKRVI